MCQELRALNGDWLSNVGEVKRILPHLVYHPAYQQNAHLIEDDYCLCCLDLEETAKANGQECVTDDDGMSFRLV